jgi:hypothetical protein
MARRKSAPEPPPPPALPAHLERCTCEDWLDVDEQPPPWATITTAADLEMCLTFIARRRFKDAQLQWAEEQGMTWREFGGTYPHSRPVFRDWPAFAAGRSHGSP